MNKLKWVMAFAIGLFLPFLMFADSIELLGAGATFPYPLYAKMFDAYYKITGVKVNYQSIGSGGGLRQIINKTVDFGASDAFMTDEQLKKVPAEILHIPIALGAVVPTYNLVGNPEIKFTPDILADIFLGKIRKWNDPRIVELNPSLKSLTFDIVVVHRSDGSGTTLIWTDYLSKVSKEWKEKVGAGTSVNWPTGIGGKGNEGVTGLVKQTPGSIGYVELIYAIKNNLPVGLVKNRSGKFIKPSLETISSAAQVNLPEDTRVSITDTNSPEGYPISGFTWILLYKEQNYDGRKKERAEALVKLLWWMTHEGQKYSKPLHYAPLPSQAVSKAEKILKSITYNGKSIL
ncbi:MAG: phosphate ABC transporter substrate-binding protein PstS [Candidatus Aminicenantia bacterium]